MYIKDTMCTCECLHVRALVSLQLNKQKPFNNVHSKAYPVQHSKAHTVQHTTISWDGSGMGHLIFCFEQLLLTLVYLGQGTMSFRSHLLSTIRNMTRVTIVTKDMINAAVLTSVPQWMTLKKASYHV